MRAALNLFPLPFERERTKVRDCSLDELSRAPHSLTCAVDDERHDHRSKSYSGAGGETRSDAGGIRADQKNSRPRTQLHRTRRLFGNVERALFLQKFAPGAEEISNERAEHSR